MRYLVIETASEACSVALFDDQMPFDSASDNKPQLLAHEHRVLGRGHAERLIPMIEKLPDKGRADRIFVSCGPGSFTGIRVGIAAARALGVAWQADVAGYSTLQLVAALALANRQVPENSGVTVCMNAGHGEWFVQNFGADGWPESDVLAVSPHEAIKHPSYDYVAGNRAQELSDLREREGSAVLETLPDARFALDIPGVIFVSDAPPRPFYGRAPDATPQKERAVQ